MYLPDYEISILSIVSSILHHYKIQPPYNHAPLNEIIIPEDRTTVILMLFDGMGSNALTLLNEECFLNKNKIMDISSVYPSATAAATRSFYSGLAPIAHGFLGWNCYFKECGRNIAILKNKDYFTGENIDFAKNILKYTTIFDYIREKWGEEIDIHHIMPAFATNGYSSLYKVEEAIVSICKNKKKKFIFLYWDVPDIIMHSFGPDSKEAINCLYEINSFVNKIARITRKTSIIVTADHGMKTINKCISLNNNQELMDCLYLPPALEHRAMSLYIKPHKINLFKDIFLNSYGNKYTLLSRKYIFNNHLFGYGDAHHKVDDFIGEYLACGIDDTLLQYISPFNNNLIYFKGHHSGLTKEELTVPLVYYEN